MRFMVSHKNDATSEAGNPPSAELIERMGALVGGYVQDGRLVDGAGLLGSKHRTRLTFRDGSCTIEHGPYAGHHELPAEILLLKVGTRDEAIGWAERYGKILGTGEIELGKVTEPWDLGLVPEPPSHPLQMMLIDKADAATEASGRTTAQKAALTRLKTEMEKNGVLVRSHALRPSSTGKRLVFNANQMRVVDGPFSESKEMIGGFVVIDLESFDEVIAMSRTYVEILGGTQVIDIRLVAQGE